MWYFGLFVYPFHVARIDWILLYSEHISEHQGFVLWWVCEKYGIECIIPDAFSHVSDALQPRKQLEENVEWKNVIHNILSHTSLFYSFSPHTVSTHTPFILFLQHTHHIHTPLILFLQYTHHIYTHIVFLLHIHHIHTHSYSFPSTHTQHPHTSYSILSLHTISTHIHILFLQLTHDIHTHLIFY